MDCESNYYRLSETSNYNDPKLDTSIQKFDKKYDSIIHYQESIDGLIQNCEDNLERFSLKNHLNMNSVPEQHPRVLLPNQYFDEIRFSH